MKIPKTFTNDLDRIAHGEMPAPTDDAEHAALLATARRLADDMRPLQEAPPGVQERLEARLVAQLSNVARQRRLPRVHLGLVRRWQAVVGIATAAALVLAIIGGAVVWSGTSQPVSAQVLLDRAQNAAQNAAPSGVTSYHMIATHEIHKKATATFSEETWYAGNDRQRTDEEVKDASGSPTSITSTIINGAEMWSVQTEHGQTNIIHTTNTHWSKTNTDPSQGGSIADLIAQYNQKGCQDVRQQGETTVVGRAAYTLVVDVSNIAACAKQAQNQDVGAKPTPNSVQQVEATSVAGTKVAAAAGGQNQVSLDAGIIQMVIAVDKQTFLPLQIEFRDPSGAVIDRYAVTTLELDVAIPATIFTYTPPAGATVQNFDGLPAQDVKATVGASMNQGTPHTNKP